MSRSLRNSSWRHILACLDVARSSNCPDCVPCGHRSTQFSAAFDGHNNYRLPAHFLAGPSMLRTSAWSNKATYSSKLPSSSAEQPTGADVSQLSPLLQRQWHPTKNAHLGSIVIKPYSHMKVYWKCDHCPDGHPHEWEATAASRSQGRSCPYCANKAVCQHNSLATKDPAVAAQLSDKNPGTAHDYMAGSGKVVTWECEQGHKWDVSISNRVASKRGCPVCAVQKSKQPKKRHPALTETQHPMMQYWNWDLNDKAGLNPKEITCQSCIRANWICHCCPRKQPHRWQARVGNMYNAAGCPCCSGRKACVCNSLQTLFPEVAAEWDHSRNKGTPSDYTAYSNSKVWWYDKQRGSFQARISSRTYVQPKPVDG